jgi:hypothetical protein
MTQVAFRLSSACSCLSVTPSTVTATVVSTTVTTPTSSPTTTASATAGFFTTFLNLLSPAALPPTQPVYVSNSSITAEIGATGKPYADPASHAIIAVEFIERNGDVFVFSINTPYTFALSTPDGEGLILQGSILQGSTVVTYFNGVFQQSYVDTSGGPPGTKKRQLARAAAPRNAASVNVLVFLDDSCGHPLIQPYVQVDCTQLAYPQLNAVAGPTPLQVSVENLVGNGMGAYQGACDALAELASYTAYAQCVAQSNQYLGPACGKDIEAAGAASTFLAILVRQGVSALKGFLRRVEGLGEGGT